MLSSDKDTWNSKGSRKDTTKLSSSFTMSSDAGYRTPNLEARHATDSDFQNVVNHKTSCLLDKSQIYNGKMTGRTSKYAKCMETLIKTYRFDEKNPIKIFRFLTQFKRACKSNKVSENTALWSMQTLIKDGPVYNFTVGLTSHEDIRTTHRLPKKGEKQIFTYAESGNILLKFYATNSNIAKSTSEIVCLRKTTMKISAQFVDVI